MQLFSDKVLKILPGTKTGVVNGINGKMPDLDPNNRRSLFKDQLTSNVLTENSLLSLILPRL